MIEKAMERILSAAAEMNRVLSQKELESFERMLRRALEDSIEECLDTAEELISCSSGGEWQDECGCCLVCEHDRGIGIYKEEKSCQ